MVMLRRLANSSLYVPDDVFDKPADARFGFVCKEPITESMTLPETRGKGWYAVFPPGQRDNWAGFAVSLGNAFRARPGTSFGWFTANGTPGEIWIETDPGVTKTSQTATLEGARLRHVIPASTAIEMTASQIQFKATTKQLEAHVSSALDGKWWLLGSLQNQIALETTGPERSCFRCEITDINQQRLAHLDAGFYMLKRGTKVLKRYRVDASRYPIFSDSSLSLQVCFDPADSADAPRTYLAMKPGTPLGTFYRTTSGRAVHLLPQEQARFVPVEKPTYLKEDGSIATTQMYFAVAGSFRFHAPSETGAPARTEFMAGGSGGEAFELTHGDVLTFEPNHPAFESADRTLTNLAKTSYVRLKPARKELPIAYRAQPTDENLFHRATNGANLLAPRKVNLRSYTTDSEPLPLFPLSGLSSADVATALVREAELLHPRRHGDVLRNREEPSHLAPPSWSITPMGLRAQVDAIGRWQKLVIARTQEAIFELEQLDAQLSSCFSSNQVFVVLSKKMWGTALTTLKVGEWKLDFPLNESGATNSDTLFVFKFGDRSIKSLIEDDAGDVGKTGAVKALKALVKEVLDNPTNLKPTSPYRRFIRCIEEPRWNGILVLDASFGLEGFPEQLRPLAAGMELEKLKLHHLGIDLNAGKGNVQFHGDADLEMENSALFGVVEYKGTKGYPNKENGEKSKYSFVVTKFQMGFDNAHVTHFESTVAIGAGSLFGTDVKGDSKLLLDGRYESNLDRATNKRHDTYRFSLDVAKKFTFEPQNILSEIVVERMELTTREGSSEKIKAIFSMDGGLKFRKDAEDLLSLDELKFTKLGIGLKFDISSGNKPQNTKMFFAPGHVEFVVSTAKPRPGSLLASFPLRLSSLMLSCGDEENENEPPSQSLDALKFQLLKGASPGRFRYGLGFDLDLGGLGSLSASLGNLKANLLLGWDPGGFVVGFKYEKSGSTGIDIGIDGVVRLKADKLELVSVTDPRTNEKRFAIGLVGATLQVLSKTLPPKSKFSGFIFVDPKAPRKVAWFAGTKRTESNDDVMGLEFVAAGQRVAISGSSWTDVRENIIDVFEKGVEKNPLILTVNPNGGWLVGAEMAITLLGGFSVGFVFNDPSLYVLHLGAKGGPLQGAGIDILYRKIRDDIGVFSIELTPPDEWRTMEFGAASLSLPSIGLEIYTNGDFRIDAGFPRGLDFSRSFNVQALPFVGAGGFYFASLSAQTSTFLKPTGSAKIFQAGLALRIGLGKSIDIGPFRAALTVSVCGILEGAVEYKPKKDHGLRPDRYLVKGWVGVLGEIIGVVNFGIVKAHITIRVYAGIGFEFGTGITTELFINAGVQVSIRVVLGSFRIFRKRIEIAVTFRFSARVEHRWKLGSSTNTRRLLTSPITLIENFKYFSTRRPLRIFFTPDIALANGDDDKRAAYAVALLSVVRANATTQRPQEFFEGLVEALVAWLFASTYRLEVNKDWTAATRVGRDVAERIRIHVQESASLSRDTGAMVMRYSAITAFLAQNFDVTLENTPDPSSTAQRPDVAFFPMIPDITIATPTREVKYWETTVNDTCNEAYQRRVQAYFEKLFVEYDQSRRVSPEGLRDGASVTMATLVFQDYCEMLARSGISALCEAIMNHNGDLTLNEAFDKLWNQGAEGWFKRAAFEVSRFFMHGLRLPPCNLSSSAETQALFALTRQMLEPIGETSPRDYAVTLKTRPILAEDEPGLWFRVPENEITVTFDGVKPSQIASMPIDIRLIGSATNAFPLVLRKRRTFALPHAASWVIDGQTKKYVLKLPRSLMAELEKAPTRVTLKRTNGHTIPETVESAWAWVTRIDFPLRRVRLPSSNPNVVAYVPHVYELRGAGSEGRRWLRALVEDKDNLVRAQLAYPTKGELVSATKAPKKVYIVRTNLAQETAPDRNRVLATNNVPSTADFSQVVDVVQLLLECSLVNAGGYYLYDDFGGQGIPEIVWDNDQTGTVSLMVTTKRSVADVGLAHDNAVVLADAALEQPDTLYLAEGRRDDNTQDIDLFDYEPTLPPGQVGFRVYRPAPFRAIVGKPGHEDDLPQDSPHLPLIELQNRFDLLEYRFSGLGASSSQDTLPLAPKIHAISKEEIEIPSAPKDANANDWYYDHILPARRLLQKAGNCPYDIIGKEITFEFGFRDVFGNRLISSTASATPNIMKVAMLYTDPIVPLSAWPGVSSSYILTADAKIPLTIRFDQHRFVRTDENSNKELDSNAIEGARTMFERILAQLEDEKLEIALQSSVGGEQKVSRAGAITFVLEIEKWLRAPTIPSANESGIISWVIPPMALAPPSEIAIEISVRLHLRRDEKLVSPFVKDKWKAIARVDSLVEPQVSNCRAPTNWILATGPGVERTSALWMIRRELVTPKAAKNPIYFAPRPVRRLLSSERGALVPVRGDIVGRSETRDISNIDIDVLLRGLLEGIETALTPSIIVPARAQQPEVVKGILDAKTKIAESFQWFVMELLDNQSGGNLESARNAFTDSLLDNLRNAYGVDSIIQLPMKFEKLPPLLSSTWKVRTYGMVNAKAPEVAKTVRLSKAKIDPQSNAPLLTFLFDFHGTELASSAINLDLDYRISHLEIWSASQATNDGSLWLKLLEDTVVDLDKVDLPIPLREFPTPPTLLSHSGRSSIEGTTAASIASLREWTYEVAFHHAQQSQDRFLATVQYNVPMNGSTRHAAATESSLIALLFGYHEMRAYLSEALREMAISPALDWIRYLAVGVANKLAAEVNRNDEKTDDRPSALIRQEYAWSGNEGIIEPTETSPPQPKPISQASVAKNASSNYQLSIAKLDLLRCENAWSGFRIVRNSHLLPTENRSTKDEFIYQTALVQFVEPYTPRIEKEAEFDLGKLGGKNLHENLRRFVHQLLTLEGTTTFEARRVQLICRYAFDLVSAPKSPTATTSILLRPMVLVGTTDTASQMSIGEFTRVVVAELAAWCKTEQPGAGRFVFDVTLFATLIEQMPLLRLRSVFVSFENWKDLFPTG